MELSLMLLGKRIPLREERFSAKLRAVARQGRVSHHKQAIG